MTTSRHATSQRASVRLATEADIPHVQSFLNAHWSRGHVLSRDRRLLDFQHRGHDGAYHLAVARDARGALLGVLGGILTSTYDPALADRDTLWLTTWKVRDDAGDAGLGLRLHRALTGAIPHAAVGTVGNNETAERIYRLLGYDTGRLVHHALIDPERDHLRLAVRGPDWSPSEPDADPDLTLRRLGRRDLLALRLPPLGDRASALPAKSAAYFAHRYLDHPRFAYTVLAVERASSPRGLLALRVAEHQGAKALRLVDLYGPPSLLAGAGGALRHLLRTSGAEFLDLFSHGIDTAVLARAGLEAVDPDGATIVPSHFEPFARRNVVLRYAFHALGDEAAVLFKADADQDRPNRVDTGRAES